MRDKIAAAFEIVNHGIEHSQYFQGCGTSHTDYTDVATGIGDTFAEALDDALESLAQNGWNVEIVVSDDDDDDGESVSGLRASEETGCECEDPDDCECDDTLDHDDERWYTVSVRVREYDSEHDEPHMKYAGIALGRLSGLMIDIANAQAPSGDPAELPALRARRDRLERYLDGRGVTFNREGNLLPR